MSRRFVNAHQTDKVVVSPSASINNLQQRTYACWVKLVSYGPSVDTSLFARNTTTYFDISDGVDFGIAYYGGLDDTGTDAYSEVGNTNVTPLNTWTHLAVTCDYAGDKKLHYFVNGTEVASYTTQTAGGGTLADDSTFNFIIGNYAIDGDFGIDGLLFDFRLYNSILTPANLAAIIANGPSYDPAPGHMVLQLTFATDQGSTEPDASGHGNVGVITGAIFDPSTPFGRKQPVVCVIGG